MSVDFDHSLYPPSLEGPRAVLPILFSDSLPHSLLDVGCGIGTWVRAAQELGISDVVGVDGGHIDSDQLLFPRASFHQQILTEAFNLERKFDVAICLEVGEHLDEEYAHVLVTSLRRHADLIYFSAACPGQAGQSHVNCQWPGYWQRLFNAEGFACDDSVRWKLWDVTALEFYYRQNLFLARRAPQLAGREPRIRPVIHPAMVDLGDGTDFRDRRSHWLKQVEEGSQTIAWYLTIPAKALSRKLARRLSPQ